MNGLGKTCNRLVDPCESKCIPGRQILTIDPMIVTMESSIPAWANCCCCTNSKTITGKWFCWETNGLQGRSSSSDELEFCYYCTVNVRKQT